VFPVFQDLPQADEAKAVSNSLFSALITKATNLAERWGSYTITVT